MINSIINFLSLPCDVDVMELIVIITISFLGGLLTANNRR